jgi:hypothetical protein
MGEDGGGQKREEHGSVPFSFEIKGEARAYSKAGTLYVELRIPNPHTGKTLAFDWENPLIAFGGSDHLQKFLNGISANFVGDDPDVPDRLFFNLSREVLDLFLDSMNLAGIERDILRASRRDAINHAISRRRPRIEDAFSKLSEDAGRSAWTAHELKRVVEWALVQLIKERDRIVGEGKKTGKQQKLTLDNVAARIRLEIPKSAPVNGEALRKALFRFDLNFVSIKREVLRMKKADTLFSAFVHPES